MRILMIGAGATSGYYGGMMVRSGRDVTFLVRSARMQQLREHGLQLISRHGDVSVQPKLLTAADLPGAGLFDVVIIGTKAYSLDAAMEDFAPGVGPETVVLPVLNGMRHLDTLVARFGQERVMGGSVRIVADVDPEGRIRQMTELDEFIFGELDGRRSQRAERLLAEFTVPGYSVKLSENIVAAMWRKWWILATMGSVCVVSGGTVGEMVAVPHGAEISLAILHEAISIATAHGYPADPAFVAEQERRMTEAGSGLTSSMYRDMVKGAPVEAEHILGDLLARANDVPVPLLTAAYVRLKVYEAGRKR